jgi:hypothetical protein
MSEPWTGVGVIETYSGRQFDVLDPDPGDVRLDDIAAGLAHTCRFGGHCEQFYSVAQHSIHVSQEFDDERLQTLALLHDTAEAYIGDIPRPFKTEFDLFDRVESAILDAVWNGLAVQPPTDDEWERVMAADDRLLAYEADRLLEDGSWAADAPTLDYDLRAGSIDRVREQFLDRSESLLPAEDSR